MISIERYLSDDDVEEWVGGDILSSQSDLDSDDEKVNTSPQTDPSNHNSSLTRVLGFSQSSTHDCLRSNSLPQVIYLLATLHGFHRLKYQIDVHFNLHPYAMKC